MYILFEDLIRDYFIFIADQQRLKKEVAADYRLSGILKEQFRERRRTRM